MVLLYRSLCSPTRASRGSPVSRPLTYHVYRLHSCAWKFQLNPCKLYMATKHIGSRKTTYIVDLARRVPTTRSFKGISCFLCPLRVHPGKLTANIATVFFLVNAIKILDFPLLFPEFAMNTGTRRRELQEVDERTTQETIPVCDCIGNASWVSSMLKAKGV